MRVAGFGLLRGIFVGRIVVMFVLLLLLFLWVVVRLVQWLGLVWGVSPLLFLFLFGVSWWRLRVGFGCLSFNLQFCRLSC